MKRFHLSIATHHLSDSITDYSTRLQAEPEVVVDQEYALWRTESLNVSLRKDLSAAHGEVRHFGWEGDDAPEFSMEKDSHGMVWEHFSAQQQWQEIKDLWPQAKKSV